MSNYEHGEIVLISFLFSDLKQYKRRPGLVLLDTLDQDIVVARITSKISTTIFDVKIKEWQKAGLLKESIVRLHKLNTLNKCLVEKKLGKLEEKDWEDVKLKLQEIWHYIF